MKSIRNLWRKREKLLEYKNYSSLDELPIWNWDKLHDSKDFKYLLIVDDYSKDYKLSNEYKLYLQATYQALIFQFDDLDLDLLGAKRDYIVKLLTLSQKLAKDSKDYDKLDKAYNIVTALMIDDEPNVEWLWDVNFTETPDQRSYLTEIAMSINRYYAIKNRPFVKQKLFRKIARIESVLGIQINEKTCSVNKFIAYEGEAIEKINLKNKAAQ